VFPTSLTKAFVAVGMASCLALVSAQPAGAASSDAPPPEKIVVDLVTVNGSGCPAGTAAVSVNPDSTKVMLSFSQYFAAAGVGAALVDSRKNCQVNFIIHAPQGYSYAIPGATYTGFAELARGAIGTVRTNYYFTGSSATNLVQHVLRGPLSDTWALEDQLPLESLLWSPCGELRNVNANTELRVYAGTSDPAATSSFLVMDSLGIDASVTYHLRWKRCPAG
jgi:hypothetical protein